MRAGGREAIEEFPKAFFRYGTVLAEVGSPGYRFVMMKPHRLRWLSFCSWFVLAFVAQGKDPATKPVTHHSLWRVESGTNVLYLLGSIHVMKESSYPLAATLEEAFKKSQVVAFETDLNAMTDVGGMSKILAAAACPPGKKISDLIDAPLYARLDKISNGYGIPVELFESMRPWMAALTLVTADIQKQGYDPDQGVDQHFFKLATQAGKGIVPLETLDEHFGLFTALTGANEAGMLKQTLDDIERLTPMMDQMIQAWKTGDGEALDKLMNDSLKDQPMLHRKLLLDRNEKWVPKLQKMLRDGKPAIAIVGMGHLVGKGSVVELLRAQGCRVVQE